MKKIAQIITRLNIGGPTIIAFILNNDLIEYGFKTALYCGELNPGETEMTFIKEAENVNPIRIKGFERSIKLFSDIRLILKFKRIFKKTRPIVVHTHQAKAGTVGRIAAWLSGVPVIIHTFHGTVFKGYFNPIISKLFVLLERLFSLISTYIIAISKTQAEELINIYKIASKKKIKIINLGFDLTNFYKIEEHKDKLKERYNIPKTCLTVGVIARLEPVKNISLFLDVAKGVTSVNKNIKFIIIGDGVERKKIEKRIDELNLKEHVILTGFMEHIWRVLADLDVVALTSISEGTPVSIIEAMAAGKAVISTDVGGVKDLIEDGKTGLLIKSGDTENYIRKLLYLLKNEDIRNNLGKAARNAIRPKYTKERFVEQIAGLYYSALNKKRIKL